MSEGSSNHVSPETTAQAYDLQPIHLALFTPDPEQPRKRFDEDALRELGDSIKAHGLIQPIVARPDGEGGLTIVAGERRMTEDILNCVREPLKDCSALLLGSFHRTHREILDYEDFRETHELTQSGSRIVAGTLLHKPSGHRYLVTVARIASSPDHSENHA